jgi:hypothetical protein
MLDVFLSLQRPCPSTWTFRADNTAAQNRNNTVLRYLAWVVATQRYGIHEIRLEFLEVGHTHTRVDGGFGHCATVLDRHSVFSTRHLVEIIRSIKNHEHARMMPAHLFLNYGERLAEYFRPAAGIIKSSVAFSFSASKPGVVSFRQRGPGGVRAGPWQDRDLLMQPVAVLAGVQHTLVPLPPVGLSARKQWLLYEQVRDLVPDQEGKDELCPLPTVPRPHTLDKTYDAALIADARDVTVASPAAAAAPAALPAAPKPRGRPRSASNYDQPAAQRLQVTFASIATAAAAAMADVAASLVRARADAADSHRPDV